MRKLRTKILHRLPQQASRNLLIIIIQQAVKAGAPKLPSTWSTGKASWTCAYLDSSQTKGLLCSKGPTCTLSQNGYGASAAHTRSTPIRHCLPSHAFVACLAYLRTALFCAGIISSCHFSGLSGEVQLLSPSPALHVESSPPFSLQAARVARSSLCYPGR